MRDSFLSIQEYFKRKISKLVQGERMKRKRKFPVLLLFFLGFLAGNLIPNIIWKIKWQQKTWASIYFLSTFAGKDISGIEYLKEIMKYRGCFYLLNVICGFSVFGEPLSVITLIASGLYTGIIMSASILEFGFAGGVIGMGLLLPQYLFYIPVWLYSMEQELTMSSEIWKNKGLIFGKISMYLRRMMFAFLLYFLGILVECFVNPWIISKILEYIKIF